MNPVNSRSILREIPCGVAIFEKMVVSYVNSAMARIFGRGQRNLVGKPLLSLVDQDVRELFESVMLPALESSGAWCGVIPSGKRSEITADIILDVRRFDDRLLLTAMPLPTDKSGQTDGHTLVSERTVTNRVRDAFLTRISRDIRTPLTSIRASTEALLDGVYGDVSGAQLRALRNIDSSGRNLTLMVNDMLDLAGLRLGEITLDVADIDLVSILRAVHGTLVSRTSRMQRTCRIDVPATPVIVSGDALRLTQALMQLVSNAIAFTDEGAEIAISLSVDERSRFATVTVSDTGIGIPADQHQRIFEPFVQLDPSRSSPSGSGVGLSISSEIIELHGGSIQISSRPGKGSQFLVSIPPHRNAVARARPANLDDVLLSRNY